MSIQRSVRVVDGSGRNAVVLDETGIAMRAPNNKVLLMKVQSGTDPDTVKLAVQFGDTGLGATLLDNLASDGSSSGAVAGAVGEVTLTAVQTLTNKRVTKRAGTVASSPTPAINTDTVDYFSISALTTAITSMTSGLSGTPTAGQTLWIAITGTASRAITWGAGFESSTATLPTTTVNTDRLDVGFIWNTVTSKWRCIARS